MAGSLVVWREHETARREAQDEADALKLVATQVKVVGDSLNGESLGGVIGKGISQAIGDKAKDKAKKKAKVAQQARDEQLLFGLSVVAHLVPLVLGAVFVGRANRMSNWVSPTCMVPVGYKYDPSYELTHNDEEAMTSWREAVSSMKVRILRQLDREVA